MSLHSHPHLLLHEHIQQVCAAMEGIFQWHTPEVAGQIIREQCELLAYTHDLGKGTKAFQKYISNPEKYRDVRNLKNHSHLSQMLSILLAEPEAWAPLETLSLAAAAYGHHSSFPTIEKMRELGGGDEALRLKDQCPLIESKDLEEETNLPITHFLLENRPWAKAKRYLDRNVIPVFDSLPTDQAVIFRLKTQLLFSILLEADKAFLAITDPYVYLKCNRRTWEAAWIDKRIGTPTLTAINKMRSDARKELVDQMRVNHSKRIFSLTAPTGIGKTLLAANWALEERKRLAAEDGVPPKIIVVLPFLSIIDQTAREYETLLRQGNEEPDGSWFLTVHSLADRQYSYALEETTEHFFIDSWRTELVITTYDQFLLALMSPKAKHQMRFHNLCDALIIMDEVQSLPCRLWKPLDVLLNGLTHIGNSRVLLMSATLPPFMAGAEALLPNHAKYFNKCKRYSLIFRIGEKLPLKQFLEEVRERLPDWLNQNMRVLLTLNTRKSARAVRDALESVWPKECLDVPLVFISADVTPLDRLENIQQISKGLPCIVVSTQCIEAGVDIDMDMVIRDFAPLDSLVQIAGRCNREAKKNRCPVEIVDLISENGRRFSEMIYDPIHLQETRRVINDMAAIDEENIFEKTQLYFSGLWEKRNLGQEHVERFAKWEEDVSVRTLLRGEDEEKEDLLVVKQDPTLKEDMESASTIEDRWQRREAWRKLAGRIARITVSIYARSGFNPETIADPFCDHWLLKEGYYDSQRGLNLPDERNEKEAPIL